jgi:transposase
MQKELPQLEKMSNEAKDDLIRELWKEIERLRSKVKELEKKPVKKTSKNSSVPPSQGFKANQTEEKKKEKIQKKTHQEGGRELNPSPDQIVIAKAKTCPHCGTEVNKEKQKLTGIYERIELPIMKPVVTRVERYGGTCECCQQKYESPVPAGLEPGSPFGNSVASMMSYLRYSHGISYERLSRLMEEVYGLKISEGAIANLLKRVQNQLESPIARIMEHIRRARLVGSDETTARVNGINQWEWVFQNEQVCLHVIRPSRGKKVIEEVMDGHCPEIWVSDLLSSQKANPAQDWQVCLAHQLRDCQYAIDAGDDLFAPRMKRLFLQTIAFHRRRQGLADSTVKQYCSRFRSSLNTILKLTPTHEVGQNLLKRYQGISHHLLLFLDDETIPPTNNASEQALRWSVIFRKITNCFRSEWGAELFAMVRSLVGTAIRQGFSAFDAISLALTTPQHDWLLG